MKKYKYKNMETYKYKNMKTYKYENIKFAHDASEQNIKKSKNVGV